jgi:hypothetical protein
MTYKPEFTVGPKSPGVWKEVRRLEAEVERLQKLIHGHSPGYGMPHTHSPEMLAIRHPELAEEES